MVEVFYSPLFSKCRDKYAVKSDATLIDGMRKGAVEVKVKPGDSFCKTIDEETGEQITIHKSLPISYTNGAIEITNSSYVQRKGVPVFTDNIKANSHLC